MIYFYVTGKSSPVLPAFLDWKTLQASCLDAACRQDSASRTTRADIRKVRCDYLARR